MPIALLKPSKAPDAQGQGLQGSQARQNQTLLARPEAGMSGLGTGRFRG